MTEDEILRRRMHGLYLSRRCDDLVTLAHELLGLHCWFHRNVMFSALIRGADLQGWKTALTKTWVHHALHGVAYEDLPDLLALRTRSEPLSEFEREVMRYMEDGVCSRAEFRQIFAGQYDSQFIDRAFSPWGGVFVSLAQRGLVAFCDMTSRDFDLISAEPTRTKDEVLPGLLRRYFAAYGPATLADAAWFLGLWKDDAKQLRNIPLDDLQSFELNKKTYYYDADSTSMNDIPEITLLSGFDPLIVSYTERSAVLPVEFKSKVIMKSGICLPTIAVNGRVAGVWNIKKNEPVLEFFAKQPKRIERSAFELVDAMCRRVKQYI
jgi:hypothetical protein